jgi:hypothetical protein
VILTTFGFQLEEGEMLYLPPFYMHQVRSLDPATVSVNMYIPAKEVIKVQKLFSFKPPIGKDWIDRVQYAGVREFLRALVEKVWGDHSMKSFAGALLEQRYNEVLMKECDVIELPLQQKPRNVEDFVDLYCQPFVGDPHDLHHAATTLSHVFDQLPPGVREISLIDYVDDGILAIVPPKFIRSYIQLCLFQ